jgi:AraC-like DNA-binding protein
MKPTQNLSRLTDPLPGMKGHVMLHQLREGLMLKYEDLTISQAQNFSMSFEPGIRIVFALDGATHIRIGRKEINFASDRPFSAAIFPVLENSLGYKRFDQEYKRELVLILSQGWLAESFPEQDLESIATIMEDHLRPFYFSITPLIHQHLLRLCCDEYESLKPLQQEVLCLTLIQETLQLVMPTKQQNSNERLTQVADKVDLLLQQDDSQQLSIKQIAHQCHSNPSTIQRIFKQRHGITLGAYRRRLQLEQGHQALKAGASVIEAAQIAGYSHLQSFSDAFRDEFGCLPKAVKRAVSKENK